MLVVIAGQNVLITTEVIENDLPLVFSKDTMKKANTYIDFANDKIAILNKEVPLQFTITGHYYIPTGKIDENHDDFEK